jgi:hypothetical protein
MVVLAEAVNPVQLHLVQEIHLQFHLLREIPDLQLLLLVQHINQGEVAVAVAQELQAPQELLQHHHLLRRLVEMAV